MAQASPEHIETRETEGREIVTVVTRVTRRATLYERDVPRYRITQRVGRREWLRPGHGWLATREHSHQDDDERGHPHAGDLARCGLTLMLWTAAALQSRLPVAESGSEPWET
jgi:hypothetical protein